VVLAMERFSSVESNSCGFSKCWCAQQQNIEVKPKCTGNRPRNGRYPSNLNLPILAFTDIFRINPKDSLAFLERLAAFLTTSQKCPALSHNVLWLPYVRRTYRLTSHTPFFKAMHRHKIMSQQNKFSLLPAQTLYLDLHLTGTAILRCYSSREVGQGSYGRWAFKAVLFLHRSGFYRALSFCFTAMSL